MIRRLLVASLASGGLAITVCGGPAVVQLRIQRMMYGVIGWSATACDGDPVGYGLFLESRLQEDLSSMQSSQQLLSREADILDGELTRLQALESRAVQVTAECRSAWQRGEFPTMVDGRAFTREGLETFTAEVLERHQSLKFDLERVRVTQRLLSEQLERLTNRIERTRSTLTLLEPHTLLFAARRLTGDVRSEWSAAIALLEENTVALAVQPEDIEQAVMEGEVVTRASSAEGASRAIDFLQGRIRLPCRQ